MISLVECKVIFNGITFHIFEQCKVIGVCILVTQLEELELMQIALHKNEEVGEGSVEEGKSENLYLCQVLSKQPGRLYGT